MWSFPVHFHFWLNFKLKREQELAAESIFNLMNQDILVLLPTAHGKSSLLQTHRLHQAMKQHETVCPFSSIIKDQTAKVRILGIKCVSFLVMNFDSFYLCLHVAMKRSLQFSREF